MSRQQAISPGIALFRLRLVGTAQRLFARSDSFRSILDGEEPFRDENCENTGKILQTQSYSGQTATISEPLDEITALKAELAATKSRVLELEGRRAASSGRIGVSHGALVQPQFRQTIPESTLTRTAAERPSVVNAASIEDSATATVPPALTSGWDEWDPGYLHHASPCYAGTHSFEADRGDRGMADLFGGLKVASVGDLDAGAGGAVATARCRELKLFEDEERMCRKVDRKALEFAADSLIAAANADNTPIGSGSDALPAASHNTKKEEKRAKREAKEAEKVRQRQERRLAKLKKAAKQAAGTAIVDHKCSQRTDSYITASSGRVTEKPFVFSHRDMPSSPNPDASTENDPEMAELLAEEAAARRADIETRNARSKRIKSTGKPKRSRSFGPSAIIAAVRTASIRRAFSNVRGKNSGSSATNSCTGNGTKCPEVIAEPPLDVVAPGRASDAHKKVRKRWSFSVKGLTRKSGTAEHHQGNASIALRPALGHINGDRIRSSGFRQIHHSNEKVLLSRGHRTMAESSI